MFTFGPALWSIGHDRCIGNAVSLGSYKLIPGGILLAWGSILYQVMDSYRMEIHHCIFFIDIAIKTFSHPGMGLIIKRPSVN